MEFVYKLKSTNTLLVLFLSKQTHIIDFIKVKFRWIFYIRETEIIYPHNVLTYNSFRKKEFHLKERFTVKEKQLKSQLTSNSTSLAKLSKSFVIGLEYVLIHILFVIFNLKAIFLTPLKMLHNTPEYA